MLGHLQTPSSGKITVHQNVRIVNEKQTKRNYCLSHLYGSLCDTSK